MGADVGFNKDSKEAIINIFKKLREDILRNK